MSRAMFGVSLNALGSLLLMAVLAMSAFTVAVLVIIPNASGGAALTVRSGSMAPGIPVGSVVIDRPVDPWSLRVGDIATYQQTPGAAVYITHRIAAIDTHTSPTTFTFKGDANRTADIDQVPATAIRGQVWFHVPYLGSARDTAQSHGARGLALAAVIAALGGLGIRSVLGVARDRRHVTRPSETVSIT